MANDLDLEIGANTKALVKDINDSIKSLDFKVLISSFKDALDLGERAFKALSGAIAAPIEEALAADSAFNQMGLSLKLAGDFSQAASSDFEDLAKSLQNTTTFSDEAVLSSVALAKNLGATNKQAKAVTLAAADLAAITGQDLNSATGALAKTLEGSLGTLGRQIPALRGLTEEQLKNGEAVKFISERYKGAAEAFGNTFSGALEQNKNAFSDLLEPIGQLITKNPIIVSAIKAITTTFQDLTAFLNNNSGEIRKYFDTFLLAAVRTGAGVGEFVAGVLRGVGILVEFLSRGFLAINDIITFLLTPLNIFRETFIKASVFIIAALTKLLGVFSNLPGVSDVFAKMGVNVDEFKKSMDEATTSLVDFGVNFDVEKQDKKTRDLAVTFKDSLLGGIKSAADGVDTLSTKLNTFANGAEGSVGKTIKGITDAVNNAPKANLFNPKEIGDAFTKGLNEGIGNSKLLAKLGIQVDHLDIKADQAELLGVGAKFAQGVLQGAKGAQTLISGLVSSIGSSLVPALGPALGPIVDALAQGPEAVKALITQFAEAIPTIIQNIAESAPIVIDVLAQKAPEIIERLVQATPSIVFAFVSSLTSNMPFIATRFAIEMVAQAPNIAKGFVDALIGEAGRLIQSIADGVKEALKNVASVTGGGAGLGGFLGGVLGGPAGAITGGVLKKFKFAEGGVVPGGAPFTDRVPALLTPGEIVLPREQSQQIIGGGPESITVQLVMSEKVLAEQILNLNRKGFRLA